MVEVDKQFRDFEEADSRKARMNRAASGVAFVGRALFASLTKKDFSDFRSSARAPNSLLVALDDYVAFRTDRRDSIIVLLVDEAQNLNNTKQVRSHLRALHSGVRGHARVLLVCFGLQATIDRLRDLGLSRIATDHTRTIGPLSDEEALQTVAGTLDVALSGFTCDQGSFDGVQRERWIGAAAQAILAESANFPHHLANGCRAFAALALAEGIADEPPIEKLREKC